MTGTDELLGFKHLSNLAHKYMSHKQQYINLQSIQTAQFRGCHLSAPREKTNQTDMYLVGNLDVNSTYDITHQSLHQKTPDNSTKYSG